LGTATEERVGGAATGRTEEQEQEQEEEQ